MGAPRHQYQAEDRDMLLCGQLPHGELLACPSAPALNGIASCLLDCDDYERIDRLYGRGSEDAASQDMLCWAAWMRMHARDPQWHPESITEDGAEEMVWNRWLDRRTDDAGWHVHRIDTTSESVETTTERVLAWIGQEQQKHIR